MNAQAEIAELAAQIKAHGFRVWVAKSGTHGFYTNKEETRVVYFQAGLGGYEMSGCYQPKEFMGNGWGLGILPDTTRETLQRYLDTWPPNGVTKGVQVKLTTLEDKLDSNGAKCSHYKEVM
jgi:hypothetical protein